MKNYSINEAVKIIGIGRTKLYQELNKGNLTAIKIGKRTLITEKAIAVWLNNLPNFSSKG